MKVSNFATETRRLSGTWASERERMRLRDGPLGTSHATAWAPPWVCFLRSILLPTITSHRTEITRFGDPFTSLARIAGHEGPPVQRVAASRGPRTDSRHSLIKFVEEPGLIAFERYKPLALRSLLSSLDLLKRTNCLLRAGVDKKRIYSTHYGWIYRRDLDGSTLEASESCIFRCPWSPNTRIPLD